MAHKKLSPNIEEWTDAQLDAELKRFGLEDDAIKVSFRFREEKIAAVKESVRSRKGSSKESKAEASIGWDSEDTYKPTREEARVLREAKKAKEYREARIVELTKKVADKKGGLHKDLTADDVVKARRDLRSLLADED